MEDVGYQENRVGVRYNKVIMGVRCNKEEEKRQKSKILSVVLQAHFNVTLIYIILIHFFLLASTGRQ